MSLLELDHVTKRAKRAAGTEAVLLDVSLRVDAGELVAVWGARRSGRTTLLRLAAGIARPDIGIVRFDGQDLDGPNGDEQRVSIAYCLTRHQPRDRQLVLDQLVTDQLVRGVGIDVAEGRACDALARAGAEPGCASSRFDQLDAADAVRVAIARALTRTPRLLLVDEPTLGVDLALRDEILLLLRSLVDDGMAVLMCTSDTPCLSIADRSLSLDAGKLHGDSSPRLAPVVALRRPA